MNKFDQLYFKIILENTEEIKYKDEDNNIITQSQLRKSYEKLKAAGDTEAETFDDYVENCIDKNGTLSKLDDDKIISEKDRWTSIVSRFGGGILGLLVGSKLGKIAGEKLGSSLGGKIGEQAGTAISNTTTNAINDASTAVASKIGNNIPTETLTNMVTDKITSATGEQAAKLANQITNKATEVGTNIGSSIGSTVSKYAGGAGGFVGGYYTGQLIEDKVFKSMKSNHNSWFVTMIQNNKPYWLTLNSNELVTDDPKKMAILSTNDGFKDDKDVQEKLTESGLYEALTDFDDIKIIGFDSNKIS